MKNLQSKTIVRPEQAVALDPVQFEFAIHYGDVSSHVPLRKRQVAEGGISLTDDDINRFGIASARFFHGDFVKFSSFLWRHGALMGLLQSHSLDSRFHRPEEKKDGAEWVHDAVIELAASLPLTTSGEFDAKVFASRLEDRL